MIPYTHSGIIASSIAMDKEISKKIFIKKKINTPKFIKYSFNKSNSDLIKSIEKKLKFPVVVKPINEGSSVNVFICTKSNLIKKIKLLENYKKIIIEKFIPGREIQAAIIGSKKLGAIELKPKRQFYDYQAKYNSKAKTQHIIPVDLSKNNYNRIMKFFTLIGGTMKKFISIIVFVSLALSQYNVGDQISISDQQLTKEVCYGHTLNTGDNFYYYGVKSTSDPMWENTFEQIYTQDSLMVPWYGVLGNHDYGYNPTAQTQYEDIYRKCMINRGHSVLN